MRPRVLFLAPVAPWSRESGSSLIIADLLEGLAQENAADIRAVFARPSPATVRPSAPAGLTERILEEPLVSKAESALQALVRVSTPMRHRFRNSRLGDALMADLTTAAFTPDIVHVEHLPMVDVALRIGRRFGAPVVFRSHNFEAQLVSRRSAPRGALGRAAYAVMARAEADAARACARTLCISDQDTALFREWAPTAAVETLACSLLLERYDRYLALPRATTPVIGFTGGLDWAPNAAGLRWFVDRAWPRIKEHNREVVLRVLARGSDRAAWLQGDPRIELVPSASEAPAHFANAWVTIAPLLEGGGVRIKIAESLALGAPVVATTIGAEGHDLPGIDRADDPSAFADAVLAQLAHGTWVEGRAALRTAVEERHGARGHARRLSTIWREEMARGRAR